MEGLGKRVALILVVVLVAANAVFWGLIYNRQAAKTQTSLTQTLTPVGSPSATASPASPAPASTAPASTALAPLPLPKVTGRELKLSIVGDSLGTGRYASSQTTRYRNLVISALQARGPVQVEEATRTAGLLSSSQQVPAGLDLAIVEVGTDDLKLTDANGFESVYGPLLKSIRAASPKAALVCAGTWSSQGTDFDNLIEQDCTRQQGTFVSLRGLYNLTENRGPSGVTGFYGVSDDLLPNDAGHRAIAGALLDPIGVTLP